MLVSLVGKPLINLITEAQGVVFDAEVSDHLQLIFGEDLQEEDRNPQRTRQVTAERASTAQTPSAMLGSFFTFPIGLLGVLTMIAFVLEVNLLESSSGSRNQSPLEMVFFPDFF